MTAPAKREADRVRIEIAMRAAQAGDLDAIAEVESVGDWLLTRRTGLGGSDVAAALGLDQHWRPIDVWLDKTGRGKPRPESDPMRWGKILEPAVAADYERTHEVSLEGPLPTLRAPDRHWHLASIDRALRGANGRYTRIVEVKTRGWHRLREYGEPDTDEVPLAEQCQCRWYAPILDVERMDVAALFNTFLRRDWIMERDHDLERELIDACDAWWHRHVVRNVEPDADGSKSYARRLVDVYDPRSSYVIPCDAELAQLNNLRLLSAIRKAVNQAYELVQQRVGQSLGDAHGYELSHLGHKRLHYKAQRGRINDTAVVNELARRLDMGPRQLAALRDDHRYEPSRPMRLPYDWRGDDISVLPAMDELIAGLTEIDEDFK